MRRARHSKFSKYESGLLGAVLSQLLRLLSRRSAAITRTPTSGAPSSSADIRKGRRVQGKNTWEHATASKDDIRVMMQCCDAELKAMNASKTAAAPFYFERVAILARKAKDFQTEVDYCQMYIDAMERFYRSSASRGHADVRKGPRYQAIVKRLTKARQLLAHNTSSAR